MNWQESGGKNGGIFWGSHLFFHQLEGAKNEKAS